MSRERRSRTTLLATIVFCVAGLAVAVAGNGGVDPYEVVVWQHADFTGQHQSWQLEGSMRHRLVTDLGWFDERISSIQVGSGVRIAVFRFPGFAGPSAVFSSDVHSLSDYWNDVISSVVIFPRSYGNATLNYPLGVTLSEVSCYAVTGYTPARSFYPLPQSLNTLEAGYTYIGDYMDDKVFYMTLQGENVEAELFWQRDFGGSYTLTMPRDAQTEAPSARYRCDVSGLWQIDLAYWYPWAVPGRWEGVVYIPAHSKTQSLKVRWIGSPPGDTRSPGFVSPQSGPFLVEPEGGEGQASREVALDISGTWQSTLQLVYVISQDGPEFSWYVERFREWGHGTIYDRELEVTWEGENGSGHDIGVAILDERGNVVRIEWGTGNVFFREGAPPE